MYPGGTGVPWRGQRDSTDVPWRGDRGRRPRLYISPGESRKTSERFRTQPITSAERQLSDRYSVCTVFVCFFKRMANTELVLASHG